MLFKGFPKMPRFDNLWCIVSEKIDGTNAQIGVNDDGKIYAGSRNRWLIEEDNFAFRAWVETWEPGGNYSIPCGRHYGEWFGKGIQRGYDMPSRYFVPFSDETYEAMKHIPGVMRLPVLYRGVFDLSRIRQCYNELERIGSQIAPWYRNPEGIVVHFPAFNSRIKWTYDGPKWRMP